MKWGSFQHAVFDAVKGKSNHGNFLFPTRSPRPYGFSPGRIGEDRMGFPRLSPSNGLRVLPREQTQALRGRWTPGDQLSSVQIGPPPQHLLLPRSQVPCL